MAPRVHVLAAGEQNDQLAPKASQRRNGGRVVEVAHATAVLRQLDSRRTKAKLFRDEGVGGLMQRGPLAYRVCSST
jgi:hypothetical protein